MNAFTASEWNRLVTLTLLEVECHVLASEAVVEQHGREDAEMALYVAQHPTGRIAQLAAEARHSARANRTVTEPHDQDFGWYCVELAAYGWRRDYDEWPTFANLTDRVASDRHLGRSVVSRRIVTALNERGDRAHLYMIRTERLTEILSGTSTGVLPWNGEEEADMRFYVAAEGMSSLMRSHYRNRCWRMEAAA